MSQPTTTYRRVPTGSVNLRYGNFSFGGFTIEYVKVNRFFHAKINIEGVP